MIAANILTGKLPKTTGSVSAKFLKGARKALDTYRGWGLRYNVDLSGFTPVERKSSGNRVATFFTLGVDSFYTLFTHMNEIDDIIYVTGFEHGVCESVLKEVEDNIGLIAWYFKKQAVFKDSNIRKTLDQYVNWQKYGHGPALASVALSFSGSHKKIYIPSTHTTGSIQCGSHPGIDPLWSTESLEIAHDALVSRVDKLATISEHQIALDLLRVCYQGEHYNCSRCTKCVRTMISLHLLGLPSHAFDKFPPLSVINEMGKQEKKKKRFYPVWKQNIDKAEELLKALKGQL